jgi:serpin B
VTGLTNQVVSVALPRFTVTTGTSLKDLLKALGMTSAFTQGIADFSGMDGTQNLFMGSHAQGLHQRRRKRHRGRSRHGCGHERRRQRPSGALVLTADRPFLYFLRDQPTGAILFMGRVLDPSQN